MYRPAYMFENELKHVVSKSAEHRDFPEPLIISIIFNMVGVPAYSWQTMMRVFWLRRVSFAARFLCCVFSLRWARFEARFLGVVFSLWFVFCGVLHVCDVLHILLICFSCELLLRFFFVVHSCGALLVLHSCGVRLRCACVGLPVRRRLLSDVHRCPVVWFRLLHEMLLWCMILLWCSCSCAGPFFYWTGCLCFRYGSLFVMAISVTVPVLFDVPFRQTTGTDHICLLCAQVVSIQFFRLELSSW